MNQKKPLIFFLTPLLLLSCLLPLDAVPLSRSLALSNQGAVTVKVADQVTTRETLEEKGVFVNGRMDIELDDYHPPAANGRHDPKNPAGP
uniref:Uncharacterized protein LOC105044921 n=1 Tax=Elaeis guineensis var. tenera TaxID=51953 RepID=A0A6I9R831_ELAGV|nr:uncharacterized protein LOC105044921 [Elaeis guineensis]